MLSDLPRTLSIYVAQGNAGNEVLCLRGSDHNNVCVILLHQLNKYQSMPESQDLFLSQEWDLQAQPTVAED